MDAVAPGQSRAALVVSDVLHRDMIADGERAAKLSGLENPNLLGPPREAPSRVPGPGSRVSCRSGAASNNQRVENEPFLQLTSVTIACPDPRGLAAFYARLLRGEVTASEEARPGEPELAGWAQVATEALRLNFEYEQHWTAPTWPAVAGQRTATQHLDIWVHDLPAAARWAVSCGATLAQVQPQSDVRVMFDPCEHPFCLFT